MSCFDLIDEFLWKWCVPPLLALSIIKTIFIKNLFYLIIMLFITFLYVVIRVKEDGRDE